MEDERIAQGGSGTQEWQPECAYMFVYMYSDMYVFSYMYQICDNLFGYVCIQLGE